MQKKSPVFITTLCRFDHFKRCVDSLSRCIHADRTELYIFVDFPSKESHYEGYNKILNYISYLKGFKEIFLIKREYNYGAVLNWRSSLDAMFQKFDSVIFTEDDNEFSPNFLIYMNACLDNFKYNDNIIGISGYNYPISIDGYEKNIYAAKGSSAWGMGLWRHKELNIARYLNLNYMIKILKSPRSVLKIYKSAPMFLSHLIYMIEHNLEFGDTMRCCYAVLKDKYTIYPSISMVRNWGNDGSGEHCGKIGDDIYSKQVIDLSENIVLDRINICEHDSIRRAWMKYFHISKQKLILYDALIGIRIRSLKKIVRRKFKEFKKLIKLIVVNIKFK